MSDAPMEGPASLELTQGVSSTPLPKADTRELQVWELHSDELNLKTGIEVMELN